MTQQLKDQLAQFTGTTQYHRFSPLSRLVATDGAFFLAENTSSFWLLDAIASHQHTRKVSLEPFQVWDLIVDLSDHTAILMAHDGNHTPIARQKISYTDFPLNSIRLYVQEGVIMLPSEY